MEGITPVKYLSTLWKEYRYVILVVVAGLVMMLLPDNRKQIEAPAQEPVIQTVLSFEDRLEILLSSCEGAGEVEVLLAEAQGSQTLYQSDRDISSEEAWREDTVIISNEDRGEAGLIIRKDPPIYSGAVILCQGADDPAVRLAITQAVSSATGLPTNKIIVLKMK